MDVSEGCAAPVLNGMACCRALPSLSTDWLDAILRTIHPGPARLSARAPPLRGCACTQLRCVQTCPCYRRETSRRQTAEASLGCLPVRPTKRGGARRKTSLAGRGCAPRCGIGCLDTLYRLGAIFPCGSPPSSLSPAGAVGQLGSCGKTRHAFACCFALLRQLVACGTKIAYAQFKTVGMG
jgi:hypothetical protein